MMAMAVDQRLALELRKLKCRSFALNEFAEKHSLFCKPMSQQIIRQQILEFVAEDRRATRFQHDNVHTTLDLRTQYLYDPLQVALRFTEHSKIVKWTSAAQFLFWHLHTPANCLQNFHRSFCRFGTEVIVEGVCPKNHLRPRIYAHRTPEKPLAKRLGRKLWKLSLRRNRKQGLYCIAQHRCLA